MFTHFPTTLPLLLITAWKLLDTETSLQSLPQLPPMPTGPTLKTKTKKKWHSENYLALFLSYYPVKVLDNFSIQVNSLKPRLSLR